MNSHHELHRLTGQQHGLVSRRQLTELGYTASGVAQLVRSHRLERISERVFRVRGSAPTPDQRAMASALDVSGGAVAMHSAASLWGMPGFTLEPLHVLADRSRCRGVERVGRPHSSIRFGPDDVASLRSIPVTTPLRTLRDLAGRIHPDRLDLVCERMLSARLIRLEALHRLGADLPVRGGAPGTRTLRRVIEARPPGYRPAESNLERRFEQILDRAGDESFERQVDLGDAEGWIGRVDYLDRRSRVVVEVQSDLFHGAPRDRRVDRKRIDRLRRAGWTVVEVFESEIWHAPEAVLTKVRTARRLIGGPAA
ncbi:MAG TPA: hypothetical protein VIY72_07235 [Acidimicrobiales bacterium]